ncbi:Angiopoietin-related protein 1,Ficolin-1-A,Angiopoietin-1,Fibrinogen C domain-containing protein 1,Ryncolin-1,Tenascin-N,Angiopoietin-related protein 7,Angiopoietin-related protein 6,Ficolin-3,Fibrinogen C domain-containing protein 1-B,Fibroleukin,Fibrinogen-like protein 1,Ficolin-1,Ficolin-1-B,Angiopoietin-4,Tenascin-R,Ryncolin-2,Techylectin-5B,Fibrinogen C domain-containing protein 1-A,Microfibril-associated glycoprotein 4,Fibrinogen-like protein A,Ryncolin-3,Angiopoietin-2,Tenascin-X,Ficolin-2,Fibrinoge|uniref:Fibrinogen C-terminal domain-containing protein n=1 Tax=Mytilus edulis TaxID=6550 RepID=A0A8S3R919_MYTED|nr:Angiopoietin-related protein 1,Ficolin-1-A,Angiopoietin-1,Fibrinogen C domain-containing protein 1,Ryncolin-1,Tenascin-N,Angiopoietin-related protein 7,Angiopoietin-related protein 6,Ficolin-3,Fibrinogen C domain-containing protein 1-B,Fibroleukin,Fibrinogen-like protein 1,Ficolin-1,Ficolin-1-B,Angiopoietin-4,Tenascin-R,Ryncolin-2,Techylectin-5B,Fibrinogen C domain-containing protein 1-A,Microfibril-associated glycoprotein 4,Fibrinogen-like protein A,Ryncolin-3,Angiopoietin-2,Tenascin-X,Ficolin-
MFQLYLQSFQTCRNEDIIIPPSRVIGRREVGRHIKCTSCCNLGMYCSQYYICDKMPNKGSVLPRECSEIKGDNLTSGVYNIFPDGRANVVQVYCDMETKNGSWTVFQRRLNGCTNFIKDWNEYRDGFGNPNREYWLGNEIIHEITSHGNHELRIEMTDFDGNLKYAEYRVFGIGDEPDGYPLLIFGYTGTAGDSLYKSMNNRTSNGVKFTTYDRDNDIYSGNCAMHFSGAWWHTDCHLSNLNGEYIGDITSTLVMEWNGILGKETNIL